MGSGNGNLTPEVIRTLQKKNISLVYTSAGVKLIGKILPIESEGSVEYLIAKKCAAGTVKLDRWDFGRGREEWDLKWVFISETAAKKDTVLQRAREIESANKNFDRFIDTLVNTLCG